MGCQSPPVLRYTPSQSPITTTRPTRSGGGSGSPGDSRVNPGSGPSRACHSSHDTRESPGAPGAISRWYWSPSDVFTHAPHRASTASPPSTATRAGRLRPTAHPPTTAAPSVAVSTRRGIRSDR